MDDRDTSLTSSKNEASNSRSLWLRVLLILFLLLIMAAGGLFLISMEDIMRDEKAAAVAEIPDPPIVASEEIKTPPEEPGGLEIEHQDKLIYERLTPAGVGVSNEDALDEVMMGLAAEEPLADFSAPDSTDESAESVVNSDSAEDSIESVSTSAELEESMPEEKNDPAPVPAASAAAPATPESDNSGDYVVQLASFPNSADANVALARVTSTFFDIIGTNTLFVQEANLGDRGVWHRLRVGYFATRAEAAETCAAFQSREQDCLVTPR